METFGWEETVIVFCDDPDIVKLTVQITNELKLKCFPAEVTTDLYAIPHFFGVVDPDKLEEGFYDIFREIYEMINSREFAIFLTKPPKVKIPRDIQRYFIISPDPPEYKQLKLHILNRRSALLRHQKNRRSFDKKLFRLFYILRKLSPEGSMVYLNDLCQEFNVSEKTIKRDIQLLKTYGEDIRYDHKKNGYYLLLSMNGISRDWI